MSAAAGDGPQAAPARRMRLRDSAEGWGGVTRSFHWIMAALVLFQLGLGLRLLADGSDLAALFRLEQLHKSWGAVILALVLLRIIWRLAAPASPAVPGPAWEGRAARGVQFGLYALLLLMPLSGWVAVSAAPVQDLLGMQNTVFGVITMPDPWVPGNSGVERFASGVHLVCAILLGGLLAIHIAAALRHGLIRRDGVLRRMITGR